MNEFHGQATAHLDPSPATIFDVFTNIDRLPSWNAALEDVIHRPNAKTGSHDG